MDNTLGKDPQAQSPHLGQLGALPWGPLYNLSEAHWNLQMRNVLWTGISWSGLGTIMPPPWFNFFFIQISEVKLQISLWNETEILKRCALIPLKQLPLKCTPLHLFHHAKSLLQSVFGIWCSRPKTPLPQVPAKEEEFPQQVVQSWCPTEAASCSTDCGGRLRRPTFLTTW